MGTASAALTTGLSAALAGDHGCEVGDVLRLAARAVIGQTPGEEKAA
jgi:hypothetical protein